MDKRLKNQNWPFQMKILQRILFLTYKILIIDDEDLYDIT